MLQERDKSGSDRSNLLRRNVHQINVSRRHNREVGILTALHDIADKRTVIIQRRISLTDDMVFFLFCS